MTTPRDRQFTPGTEERLERCSFCNMGPEAVGELVEGPAQPGSTPACICRDCAELCVSILEHRKTLGGAAQERDRSPIDAATQEALKEKIDQALSVLGSLEREIITLRYGLSNGYTHTLDEVARVFGITRDRVREIESSAVRILGSRRPQT